MNSNEDTYEGGLYGISLSSQSIILGETEHSRFGDITIQQQLQQYLHIQKQQQSIYDNNELLPASAFAKQCRPATFAGFRPERERERERGERRERGETNE